ncbi:MAG TPA: DUF4214 domain-containing protein [Pirellulales bacterium]|nr:DUF4214 domain-containing protein [Pirellulales bacterium]
MDWFTGLRRRRSARRRSEGLSKKLLRGRLEALESRALLTTFYVDNNLLVTADRDSSGGLSPGDQVTFAHGQNYQQADLTYNSAPLDGDVGTAFSSLGQALASPLVQPGDTIDIAGGTYSEGGLTISENLTLVGEGSVVIAAPQGASQPGLSIIDQPDNVAIKNLSIQGFPTSLSDTGGGTLTLVDVGLVEGDSSVSNLTNLDVVSDSAATNTVIINIVRYVQPGTPIVNGAPAPSANGSPAPSNVPDNIWSPGQFLIDFSGVKNLSFATGAGVDDTIGVSPLPDTTVTIDGNDSTPPGAPGDTLELATNFFPGSSFTAARDSTGLSGTWTVNGSQPVNFSHIASLSPGIGTQNVPPITGTQGVDTGSQVVAQFTDPTVDAVAAGDTAKIYWQDGTTSAGTITYDAASGIYSVLGSHTYTEGGNYTVSVSLNTPSGVVLLPNATANIAATTTPQLSPIKQWTVSVTVGQSTANQDLVTFGDSVHLPPSDYSAEINWGDGTTSSGTIAYDPGSWTFTAFGDHSYAQPGTEQIAVTIFREGALAGTMNATAYVSASSGAPGQTGTPPATGTSAATPSERLVAQIYHDLLGRPADPAGLAYWSSHLDAGMPRSQFVTDVLASAEYRRDEVNSLYQHYLHRSADASALAAGSALLAQGMTDKGLAALIIGSDEYFALHGGTNDGFVSALFQDALGRPVDAGAKNAIELALADGATRAQMAAIVLGSHEYRADLVANLYLELLNRTVDAPSAAAWAAMLDSGATDEQVLAAIAASDEFLNDATN